MQTISYRYARKLKAVVPMLVLHVLFVALFLLRLFDFVCFLFLLVSGGGRGVVGRGGVGWGGEGAATYGCGTPWAFFLPFLFYETICFKSCVNLFLCFQSL